MLVSPEYREQLRLLHEQDPYYGRSAERWLSRVVEYRAQLGAESVLDYGAGKGYLKDNLAPPVREYDPGIPEKAAPPEPADLVTCLDVFNHVEPECVDHVLMDIERLANKGAFIALALYRGKRLLPNGQLADFDHHDAEWWRERASGVWRPSTRLHVEHLESPGRSPLKSYRTSLILRMEK